MAQLAPTHGVRVDTVSLSPHAGGLAGLHRAGDFDRGESVRAVVAAAGTPTLSDLNDPIETLSNPIKFY